MTVIIVFTNITILRNNLPLKSKYSFLYNFFNDLDKFDRLKPQKENTNVHDAASELYNEMVQAWMERCAIALAHAHTPHIRNTLVACCLRKALYDLLTH